MMKSNKWRVLSLVLVFVLMVSLAACKGVGQKTEKEGSTAASGTGETTSGAEKPLYRIPFLTSTSVVGDLRSSDETDVGKYIKEKFNIVFDFMLYTGKTIDKQHTMLAAGDYPEIVNLQGEDVFQKYLSAGVPICFDDYLDKMPNFKELFKTQIPYWRALSEDGKLYKYEQGVPQEPAILLATYGVSVRYDVLEKQGFPRLLSTTDYINFIRQGMKDFPETNGKKTIGMSMPVAESWGLSLLYILFQKGETYPSLTDRTNLYNAKKDVFEPLLETQEVKDSVHFFNRLYREGLLDSECFTDMFDQVVEKCKEARPIAVNYVNWATDTANSDLIKRGEDQYFYIHLPVQTDAQVANNEKFTLPVETTRPFESRIITKNAKNPERIIEMLDWACSDEGLRTLRSGIKGKHYTVENGITKMTQEVVENFRDEDYFKNAGINIFYAFLVGTRTVDSSGIPYNIKLIPDERVDSQHARQKEVYNAQGYKDYRDMMLSIGKRWESGLVKGISVGGNEELNKHNSMIKDYMWKNLPKTVINPKNDAEFEAEWGKLIEGYNKLEPQKLVDESNKRYLEKKEKLELMKGK
jgi:putative aldouronate transport system substrate-binding protein